MSSYPPIRRRSVLVGAAWSAPVIAVATAAPALAASAPQLVFRFATLHNQDSINDAATFLVILGNTGAVDYPAGATFEFSFSQGDGSTFSRSTALNTTYTRGVTATRVSPPPMRYQSYWRFTLTAPVPAGTGNFPLSNPMVAFDIDEVSTNHNLHMTFGHITASPGTSTAQGLPVGNWFDSSGRASATVVGWWNPSSGSTYPDNLNHLYRTI